MLSFINTPMFYIIILLVISLLVKFAFGITFSNCNRILGLYLENFTYIKSSNGKKKYLMGPIFYYFVVPLTLAFIVTYIKCLDKDIINMITVIFSILIGMLFNVLVLLIDIQNKILQPSNIDGSKIGILTKLLKETYYAIMFEIFIAIILLIICFSFMFMTLSTSVNAFVSLAVYVLIFIFLFNLFIVLKRIFVIFEQNFKQ